MIDPTMMVARTSDIFTFVNPSDAILGFIVAFILPVVLFIVAIIVFVIPPITSKIKMIMALGLVIIALYLAGAFDSILGG